MPGLFFVKSRTLTKTEDKNGKYPMYLSEALLFILNFFCKKNCPKLKKSSDVVLSLSQKLNFEYLRILVLINSILLFNRKKRKRNFVEDNLVRQDAAHINYIIGN